MTLQELIDIADAVYPDGLVGAYHQNITVDNGDTLAKFLVIELRETFDTDASDDEQLAAAERAVYAAIGELEAVREALTLEWSKRQKGKDNG